MRQIMKPDRRLLLCCVVAAWSCCAIALTDAEREVFDEDDSIEKYWRDSGDSDIPSILRQMYRDLNPQTHPNSDDDGNKPGKDDDEQEEDFCQKTCGIETGTENDEVECKEDERKCECKGGEKKFDYYEKKCRATCNDDCENGAGCVADAKDGESKFCKCLAGTSGDTCDIIDDCDPENGRLKRCDGGENGECGYDKEKEVAECRCNEKTKLKKSEGRCAVCDCGPNSECRFNPTDGEKICSCKDGYELFSKDEMKNGCKITAEKCREKCGVAESDLEVVCDPKTEACGCMDDRKQFDSTAHECRNCSCGLYSSSCSFVNGEKKCECKSGFEPIKGLCKITEAKCKKNCGENFENGVRYCSSDSDEICQCGEEGKKFQYSKKECKKSCETNDDCRNGANCKASMTKNKFCECLPGTTGDLCEVIPECNTKYIRCIEELGTCTYDAERKVPVCLCPEKKALDEKQGYCRVCECGANAINCTFVDGLKTCNCKNTFADKGGTCENCDCGENADRCSFGSKGEKICDCKENYKEFDAHCHECDCGKKARSCEFDDTGEKKCTCEEGFIVEDGKCTAPAICIEACGTEDDSVRCEHDTKTATCVCEDPKKFDYSTKRCRGICDPTSATPCDNGAQCVQEPSRKKAHFCSCLEGTAGDRCKEIEDCKGKYKNCSGDEKGHCVYDPAAKAARCECRDYQSLKDVDLYCETCVCGPDSTNCTFVNNEKTCHCREGFEVDQGRCKECKCGENSVSCSFKGGKKMCNCKPRFEDDDGTCKACYCGVNSIGCRYVGGVATCECKKGFSVKNGKCEECECGDFSINCKFEGDKKVCECNETYADNDGTCEECDCGENSQKCSFVKNEIKCDCNSGFSQKFDECAACTCGKNTKPCRFEGDEKKCECKDKYALKNGTCAACKCGPNSKGCKFEGTNTICDCEKGYGNKDGKCLVNYCYTKCGVEQDKENDDVRCEGDILNQNVNCTCQDDDRKFDSVERKCRAECSGDDKCKNGAKCKKRDYGKFCVCLPGTEGDACEVVTDCEGAKFKKCREERGKCTYNVGEKVAVCECTADKLLDTKEGYCQKKCGKNEDCSNEGKICHTLKYCTCEEGKEGDKCEVITGCTKELKKQCKDAEAECVFDKDEDGRAACLCINEALIYDKSEKKCVSTFCKDVGCKGDAKCEYDELTDTGYCKCPRGYYDYKSQKCQEPDKCLLRKTPCKENEKCENGVCKCKYEMDGDQCKQKFCQDDKACFRGANCSQADGSCYCAAGKYFSGSECKDAECISAGLEKCACPTGMQKKDGKCEPSSGKSCDKKCGYGYCVDDKCLCVSIAKNVKDTCILDAEKVCASKKLTSDSSKCECTGKYKQAKDGITCDLVTCSDEAAKKDCQAKGATCEMQWTGTFPGYFCKCRAGYAEDLDKGICADPCSRVNVARQCTNRDRFCYNSYAPLNPVTVDCECPPPFTQDEDGNCGKIAEHVLLMSNIPVVKKRYEMRKDVDHVLLNADLVQAISQMFSAATFDYAHLNDYAVEGGVVLCSVWIRFKDDPKNELERIAFQAQNFPNTTCEDCDPELFLLPPSLMLSKKDFGKVKYENMTMCSKPLKNALCGEEAECKDNKCFCPRGYKPIEYTIRDFVPGVTVLRCEAAKKNDFDECAHDTHQCSENTTCVKIPGDYICQCKPGFKKETENDKNACQDLCTPSPCENKGECSMKDNMIRCKCKQGFTGSLCEEKDVRLAGAKKNTVIVGAVLGSLLGVLVIAFFVLYRKVRKSTYSEDFMPAPRQDHAAEMMERRPVRGVVNKSYE